MDRADPWDADSEVPCWEREMTGNDIENLTVDGHLTVEPGKHAYFFDLAPVLASCPTLRANPERLVFMCQSLVRSAAPGELMIPRDNGFFLIVRSRDANAETVAADVNLALLRRFFGTEALSRAATMFVPVSRPAVENFEEARDSAPTRAPRHGDDAGAGPAPASSKALRDQLPGSADLRPGCLPLFGLQQDLPPVYLCGPVSPRGGQNLFGAEALKYCHPDYRPIVDVAILNFGVKLLPRDAPNRHVSAVAIGVSYETLAWSRTRQLWQAALRAGDVQNSPNIIIKIDDVPNGVPAWRLAELIAGLKPFVKRVFVHLPECDVSFAIGNCIGAAGFCANLAPKSAMTAKTTIVTRLCRVAATQRALSCVIGADNGGTLDLLRQSGVRLASKPQYHGFDFGDGPQDIACAMERAAA
jgi:hypothetical protein